MTADEFKALNVNDKWPKAKKELQQYLTFSGTGPWVTEHVFHPTRKWRLDWANVDLKVGIEYDGVTGATAFNRKAGDSSVGHVSVGGVMRDAEKTNEAQLLGWVVIRVNAKTIKSGDAFTWIERAVERALDNR